MTIFFDYEGVMEVPYRPSLNMNSVTRVILKILDRFGADSTFNVVGRVAQLHPDLIREISESGHEVASHSWMHDNVAHLSVSMLRSMLTRTSATLEKCTGHEVVGFRSPWLLSNQHLHSTLKELGYIWVSNVYSNYFPERFLRPGIQSAPVFSQNLAYGAARILRKIYREDPRIVDGLIQIPMLSPMDGQLLGMVNPEQETPPHLVDYMARSVLNEMKRTKLLFNINLHDWIIGTMNRPEILDKILTRMTEEFDVRFVTATQIAQRATKKYVL